MKSGKRSSKREGSRKSVGHTGSGRGIEYTLSLKCVLNIRGCVISTPHALMALMCGNADVLHRNRNNPIKQRRVSASGSPASLLHLNLHLG